MSHTKTASPTATITSNAPTIDEVQARFTASLESDDLASAYDNLMELNRLQPGSPALETMAGVFALQLAREGEATTHFAKALSLAPDDYDTNYNMALDERRRRRYDLALERLNELRRQHPNEASLLNDIAVIWSDKGQPGRSLACFSRALKLDPNACETRNHAMQFCLETGRVQPGLKMLRRQAENPAISAKSQIEINRWRNILHEAVNSEDGLPLSSGTTTSITGREREN